MEGVAASRYTVKVDTVNGRLDVATTVYNGGIASVGLFTSSNLVVGNNNGVVLYATGSIKAASIVVDGSALTPPSTGYAFLAATQTFVADQIFSATMTVNGRLISPQVVTTWGLLVGTAPYTVLDGINITSMTYIGLGDYRINFSTPYANPNFAASCTADALSGFTAPICALTATGTRDVRSVRVATFRSDSTPDDVFRINLIVVGRQNP